MDNYSNIFSHKKELSEKETNRVKTDRAKWAEEWLPSVTRTSQKKK